MEIRGFTPLRSTTNDSECALQSFSSRNIVRNGIFSPHGEIWYDRLMALYHLTTSVGSAARGQSAAAKTDYILREERYDGDRMEVEHREHGNMPKWAEADPRAYWQAADDNERANGRLFCQVEGALPIELGPEDRQALARRFARRLTDREQLPYTLAVHRGGHTNPHFHLVISERRNDGIERSAEQWFKRYNGKNPERGGARKTTDTHRKEWLGEIREVWTQEANRALARAGSPERIDHRSLAERAEEAREAGDLQKAAELSREPGRHLGPAAAAAGRILTSQGQAQYEVMFHAFSWVLREALERQERNDTWKEERETLTTDQRQADDQVDTLTLQLQGGGRDITRREKELVERASREEQERVLERLRGPQFER